MDYAKCNTEQNANAGGKKAKNLIAIIAAIAVLAIIAVIVVVAIASQNRYADLDESPVCGLWIHVEEETVNECKSVDEALYMIGKGTIGKVSFIEAVLPNGFYISVTPDNDDATYGENIENRQAALEEVLEIASELAALKEGDPVPDAYQTTAILPFLIGKVRYSHEDGDVYTEHLRVAGNKTYNKEGTKKSFGSIGGIPTNTYDFEIAHDGKILNSAKFFAFRVVDGHWNDFEDSRMAMFPFWGYDDARLALFNNSYYASLSDSTAPSKTASDGGSVQAQSDNSAVADEYSELWSGNDSQQEELDQQELEARSDGEYHGENADNYFPADGFWGIWTTAAKDKNGVMDAYYAVWDSLFDEGYTAGIVTTSKWSNLNPEKWYAVCVGPFSSQSEADSALKDVKAAGYDSAYVKFSGAKK